jgi:hypothetical protein
MGKVKFGRDYRLPNEMSDDYWMFAQWAQHSARAYRCLVLGDSVVWGQYTRKEGTLPHYLNEIAGGDVFANLGVDGMHPAAMPGLVKYFGRDIRNKRVLLHLNPLWMTSKRHDLQVREEFRFNHPRLVPQVFVRPPCYHPSFNDLVGVLSERYIPFFRWKNHLNTVYFDRLGFQEWTLGNPYGNPFSAGRASLAPPDEGPRSQPISWRERGITPEDFPWVDVRASYQWRRFENVLATLQRRGNKVFVLLGPFNAYMLPAESRARYQAVKQEMEQSLRAKGVRFCSASLLSSDQYADASHPLEPGYRRVAEELFRTRDFKTWLENSIVREESKDASMR